MKLNYHLLVCCLMAGLAGCRAEVAPESRQASDQSVEAAAAMTADSGELQILAWNVESGGADPTVIAERLARMNSYDIVCLSEVFPDDFETFQKAKGDDFQSVASVSGNEDRLQILYNARRFELLEKMELTRHRDFDLNTGSHRSPMALRLRDQVTDKQFIVMVNHLARGNADFRTQQAIGLREWARDQSVGIINVGDFNMDYVFATERGNEALDEIRRDNVWTWVQPKEWIDSNWYDPEGDGVDNYEGSLLDFVFVAGPAKDWQPISEVIVESGDFPDDSTTSDHRPIAVRVDLSL